MLKVIELYGIPDMAELARLFPDRSIPSVEEEVPTVLDVAGLNSLVFPGERVAVTAGSRGIKNNTDGARKKHPSPRPDTGFQGPPGGGRD